MMPYSHTHTFLPFLLFLLLLLCGYNIKSSIVVTGVPTKAYRMPTEWIQPNTTVVNVASFKNVDEESLLKVPGVVYVPMVGKVTVAMLERNLMRLYEQFHSPESKAIQNNQKTSQWNLGLHLYTAAAVTLLLALQLKR
mmetsp:Transcript_10789/g.26090  ORF Transcript_10789/g.26090 Transcript_10789/m.26090 type:complete len:138 (-) Transcript_10789:344-757(-)